MFDKSGKLIYQDLRERAFEKDQIGRLSHFSKVDRDYDHFYGFGEKTGHLDKKGRRLRMSPKDAIGHDPETGDPMYKHIPFYIRVNEHDLRPVGLFYHNSYDCVFDLGESCPATGSATATTRPMAATSTCSCWPVRPCPRS